ncbi:MAG: guanylate kinase, partial [Betaproteobacteria bacterium]
RSARLSVSHTTRAPRPGELDGHDYHFVSRSAFEAMIERGEFLESADVHGNLYGTSQGWIDEQRAHDVGIFILPPSVAALRRRLNERGQDSTAVIERRLQAAQGEISHLAEFDYVMINNNFDDAVEDLVSIVRAARLRIASQVSRHSDLINSLK